MAVKVPLTGSVSQEKRRGVIGQGVDWSSIPIGERFNPYEYITQDDYRNTQRGQAAYAEDLARLQYLADLAQQDWQNAYNEARVADERSYNEKLTADDREYNSYANQVALMKQAGLNPDLLGVSAGSSQTPTSGTNSSASGSDVSTNPMSGIMTNGQIAGNVVSIIGSVAQTALSLYTGNLSATGISIANLASSIGALGGALDTFDSTQGSYFSNIIDSSPLSASNKRKIKKFYQSYVGTPRFETSKYGASAENILADFNYKKVSSNPYIIGDSDFNLDGVIDIDDWSSVWKPVFKAEYDNMVDTLKFDKESRNFQRRNYFSESSNLDYLDSMRYPLLQVAKNMKSRAEKGDYFYSYALMVLHERIERLYNSHNKNGWRQNAKEEVKSFANMFF